MIGSGPSLHRKHLTGTQGLLLLPLVLRSSEASARLIWGPRRLVMLETMPVTSLFFWAFLPAPSSSPAAITSPCDSDTNMELQGILVAGNQMRTSFCKFLRTCISSQSFPGLWCSERWLVVARDVLTFFQADACPKTYTIHVA